MSACSEFVKPKSRWGIYKRFRVAAMPWKDWWRLARTPPPNRCRSPHFILCSSSESTKSSSGVVGSLRVGLVCSTPRKHERKSPCWYSTTGIVYSDTPENDSEYGVLEYSAPENYSGYGVLYSSTRSTVYCLCIYR
jgi:hypothetical protein